MSAIQFQGAPAQPKNGDDPKNGATLNINSIHICLCEHETMVLIFR